MARDARDAVMWLRDRGVLGPVFAPRLRAEGIDLRVAYLSVAYLSVALRWSSDPSLSGWTLRDGVLAREVLS
jgi:hypothetical protein